MAQILFYYLKKLFQTGCCVMLQVLRTVDRKNSIMTIISRQSKLKQVTREKLKMNI